MNSDAHFCTALLNAGIVTFAIILFLIIPGCTAFGGDNVVEEVGAACMDAIEQGKDVTVSASEGRTERISCSISGGSHHEAKD